jgi:Asp-tRNA(Asn)/Glu-tRNA(Gln) amidotransferase A subunit family amidase
VDRGTRSLSLHSQSLNEPELNRSHRWFEFAPEPRVRPFNVLGLPAISIPATPEDLPVELKIVGKPFDEAEVLAAAIVLRAS